MGQNSGSDPHSCLSPGNNVKNWLISPTGQVKLLFSTPNQQDKIITRSVQEWLKFSTVLRIRIRRIPYHFPVSGSVSKVWLDLYTYPFKRIRIQQKHWKLKLRLNWEVRTDFSFIRLNLHDYLLKSGYRPGRYLYKYFFSLKKKEMGFQWCKKTEQ